MSDKDKDDLFNLIREAKEENIALKAICASLLCEVAILHLLNKKNPREKLGEMAAGLQGMAEGVAMNAGVSTQSITATIERVCTMAEAVLQGPKDRS